MHDIYTLSERPAPPPAMAAAAKRTLYHLPLGQTTYSHASRIQESLVALHLAHKSRLLTLRRSPPAATRVHPPLLPPPPPTIVTSEFYPPVYTSGLRQRQRIPQSQKDYLTLEAHPVTGQTAEFVEARRGGQITWHGQGQVTIYPVVDLRAISFSPSPYPSSSTSSTTSTTTSSHTTAALPKHVGARDWVYALEGVTIDVLHRCGVDSGRDPVHPGVWVGEGEDSRKITAVGVHVRRFVANHGVGINVDTDPWWWERVVACGIEGRGVTCLKMELERLGKGGGKNLPGLEDVGKMWVEEMARERGFAGVVWE